MKLFDLASVLQYAEEPPLTSWPKYQESTLYCFFVKHHVLFYFRRRRLKGMCN